MNWKKILAFTSLFFLGTTPAFAQISVNDVIIHFKAGVRPVHNLVVTNGSEEILYVTATADKVEKPGEDDSPRTVTDNLLVSPKKFSIDGKGERAVRLVLKKPPTDKEELYRVMFVPQDRGFGDDIEQNTEAPQAVLKVLTGMGVLVFVDPANPEVKLSWTRKNNKTTFRNDGNVHVRLLQGKACIKENVDCTDIAAKRIYGGTEYTINVDDKKTLYFTKREGTSGDFQSLVIPPST